MEDARRCPSTHEMCTMHCIEPYCADIGDSYPPVRDEDDHLTLMLRTQRMLQIDSFGIDPAEASIEERVAYIRWNVQAAGVELNELMSETSWKMWTHGEPFINSEAAFKEWIDVWHFMMNILWALTGLGTMGDAGVLADEVVSAYMKKKDRNAARQREGYTGLVGGAEHDAEHVER